MTARCEACGTENRDKAMFCRGCAGKMPAFVPTRRPSDDRPDGSRPIARAPGTSEPSTAASASSPPAAADRSGSVLTGPRIAVIALAMTMLGAVIAWFGLTSSGAARPADVIASAPVAAAVAQLSPEASLSPGETLEAGRASDPAATSPALASPSPDKGDVAAPRGASGANSSSEISTADVEPSPPARSAIRRPAPVPSSSNRASDPRAGCEHLFFAFAARCEANHCQLPAYARHPRCEVVREQRRRDDARRNSMPTS